jgi:hypothetical protein
LSQKSRQKLTETRNPELETRNTTRVNQRLDPFVTLPDQNGNKVAKAADHPQKVLEAVQVA